MKILSAQCDADMEIYKNEPISTKRVVRQFTLDKNVPVITKFCDYMDTVVMESVDGVYFFFFWAGLHDPIACSLLGGGIPS